MPESTSSRAPGLSNLSARTTAVLLQLLMWVLLCGFYFAWNDRPNYNFEGPIWPLVLMQMGFAVLLFNSLVYLIIPRWLLQGHGWLALGVAVALVYIYRIWHYAGTQLADTFSFLSPDLGSHLRRIYVQNLWQGLTGWRGFLNTFLDLLITMMFPVVVSFLAYSLIVERRRLALERSNLHLELSYLKTQINPQFLFSTLAQLQHLTRTHDQRAGDVVLHLADLMRYTLYETDSERVPLHCELDFLDDYLALERLQRPKTTIRHQITGTVITQQIAPLLLHPFLERLFAGLDTADSSSSIISTMRVASNEVVWDLSRSTVAPLAIPYRTDAAIVAVLRQLQLQYPRQHTVQLTEEAGQVHAHLSIRF